MDQVYQASVSLVFALLAYTLSQGAAYARARTADARARSVLGAANAAASRAVESAEQRFRTVPGAGVEKFAAAYEEARATLDGLGVSARQVGETALASAIEAAVGRLNGVR